MKSPCGFCRHQNVLLRKAGIPDAVSEGLLRNSKKSFGSQTGMTRSFFGIINSSRESAPATLLVFNAASLN